jgi:hypothetical protein
MPTVDDVNLTIAGPMVRQAIACLDRAPNQPGGWARRADMERRFYALSRFAHTMVYGHEESGWIVTLSSGDDGSWSVIDAGWEHPSECMTAADYRLAVVSFHLWATKFLTVDGVEVTLSAPSDLRETP